MIEYRGGPLYTQSCACGQRIVSNFPNGVPVCFRCNERAVKKRKAEERRRKMVEQGVTV